MRARKPSSQPPTHRPPLQATTDDTVHVHWYVRFLEDRVDELRNQLSLATLPCSDSAVPAVPAAPLPEPDVTFGERAELRFEEQQAAELAREWAMAAGSLDGIPTS